MARQAGSPGVGRERSFVVRHLGRRKEDRYTEAEVAFGRWMANRATYPAVVIDEKLTAFYVNSTGRKFAKERKVLRVARRTRKLALVDKTLQSALPELMNKASRERPLVIRMAGQEMEIEVCCLQWRWPKGTAFAISFSEQVSPQEMERRVLEKIYELTAKEVTVAMAVYDGMSLTQIAAAQKLARETVRTHLHNVYEKLNVTSQNALVRRLAEIFWKHRDGADA